MLRAASGMPKPGAAAAAAGRRAPLLLLLLLALHRTNALPLQYLPEIPGYIPVYIRHGDQPLEEINPALAAAFHESTNIRENRLNEPVIETQDLSHKNDVPIDSTEDNAVKPNSRPPQQLIYTLPKKSEVKPKPSEKESVVMKIHQKARPRDIDIEKIKKVIKEEEGNNK